MCKKFLVDFMLGRLARWLRILGYDAVYTKKVIDSLLMVNAYKEGRIIITRNTRLYRRAGPANAVFINSDDYKEQVREVIKVLDLEFDRGMFLSRCADCNLPLINISKEMAQTKVPEYVFQTRNDFRTCPQCKRIFWSGSHPNEMMRIIKTFWGKKGELK